VLIRAARNDDFEAAAAILEPLILHTAIHFAYEPVPAAELRGTWLRQRETYPFLVADAGGEVVGFTRAGPWRERAAYLWTPESGVYVRDGHKRTGVGRALYARLFDILRAQGFVSVMAGISLPNDPSVRLHQAFGFVPVGHVPRAGWKHGRWHAVGFWQKDLAQAGTAPGDIRPPVY
jgi:phosphinothricin acetyltransferase